MTINGIEIQTPYENPLQYEPDWRYQVAKSWAADNSVILPFGLDNDNFIVDLKNYIIESNLAENDALVSSRLRPYRLLLNWYSATGDQSPRHYIEPLLLTGVKYDALARDMAGTRVPPRMFELYERLFFNVRDEGGDVSSSCYLRSYMAMPTSVTIQQSTPEPVMWRVAATQYGYAGLMRLWRWRGFHGPQIDDVALNREITNMAQALIMQRILRSEVNNFDLNVVFSNYIQYENMRQATGKAADTSTPEAMLLKVLGIMRPKMLSAASSADELLAMNKVLQERIEAQKAVQAQSVLDRGLEGSLTQLNNAIDQHFVAATNGSN